MRPVTLLFTFLFAVLISSSAYTFEVRDMQAPESFIVDASTGVYYVSNVVGSAGKKDNKGYIVRISPDGKQIDREFIRSGKNGVTLNAPKGLAISGDDLFVADIDAVRRFDKDSGRLLGTADFALLGVKSLNDLTLDPEGNVYASDTFGNAIYKIDPARNYLITLVAKTPRLGNPNGLVFEARHKRLLVATWGLGKLIAVNLDGSILPIHKRHFKGLDGIALDREGNILLSSFTSGTIYRIKQYSTVEVLRKNMVTPADISFDYKNNRVLVPSFDGNLVFTFPLER